MNIDAREVLVLTLLSQGSTTSIGTTWKFSNYISSWNELYTLIFEKET